jgi:hypothetical protein
MSSDATSGQDHLPPDEVPAPTEPSADAAAYGADAWGTDFGDAFADPAGANFFSAEIENVNATDWDVDADSIWGDDGVSDAVDDGGIAGLDFLL